MFLAELQYEEPVISKFLHPGELFVSDKPFIATTVLGSCISVCLWDPVTRAGGLNHFVMPEWNPQSQGEARPYFGNVAMHELLTAMVKLGVDKRRLQAHVYGGSALLHGVGAVGFKNIAVAMQFLDRQNIAVSVKQVGGMRGRKIIFDSLAGKITVYEV